MSNLTDRVSFWTLCSFAILVAVQFVPGLGSILSFFGISLLAGLAAHGFLGGLIADAVDRKLPRVLLVVPVVAWGSYYVLYVGVLMESARAGAEIGTRNPGKVLQFDPHVHSLVVPNAREFMQEHAIPVAYEPITGYGVSGYRAYRVLDRAQCDTIRQSGGRRVGFSFNGNFQQDLCFRESTEAPSGKIISTTSSGDDTWQMVDGIRSQTIQLDIDGAVIGSYVSAFRWQPLLLPALGIGCWYETMDRKRCGVDFIKSRKALDTRPPQIDRELYDSPVSVMLGIRRLTAKDLETLKRGQAPQIGPDQ